MKKYGVLIVGLMCVFGVVRAVEKQSGLVVRSVMSKPINAQYIGDAADTFDPDYDEEELRSENRWFVPVVGRYSFGNQAFDESGKQCSLSNFIFGKEFTIGDIYLFSKLSRDTKISSNNVVLDIFQRPSGESVSNASPYGKYGSDQFVGLLALTKINIEADRKELATDISTMYRFPLGRNELVTLVVGGTVPVKSITHTMDLQFGAGSLPLPPGILVAPVNGAGTQANVPKTPAIDFFSTFMGMEDFFINGILAPKGLKFNRFQRKTGIGDVQLFSYIDFAHGINDWCDGHYADTAQMGLNLVAPTGNKDKGDRIWEPLLGNGGAFQADLFGQFIFRGPMCAFNPVVRLSGSFSAPFTNAHMRVPKIKSNVVEVATPRVQAIPDLLFVDNFKLYFVQPFNESDVTVPMFADQAVPARVQYGSKIVFGVGNYWYNFFDRGFKLGLFYEFMHKAKDKICVTCDAGTFDTTQLVCRTDRQAHTASWSCSYDFANLVQLSVGGSYIFAGKNVPHYHDIVGSFAIVF